MKITNEIFLEGNLIKDSTIKVIYKGKFIKEFSNQVIIMYGYGLGWKNIQEKKMTWTGDSFVAEIDLIECGELNFCFKNDFGSWDNNNGNDYCVQVVPNESSEETFSAIKNDYNKTENVIEIPKITEKNKTDEIKIENIVKNFEEDRKQVIEKKDRYKRYHIPEKNNETLKKIKDNEESLFEYVNNSKQYEDKYFNVNDIVNGKITKKTDTAKSNEKNTKKTKKKASKLKKAIRLICVVVLCACIIYFVNDASKVKNIQEENKNLLNIKIDESALNGEGVTERMLKVKELNSQYPDLKAWIEIKDTVINYPIMQGTDNSYYVNHNYKKEYSKWGALFLDKEYDWSKPSSNLLIYGHNFSDGLMFADLLKYRDKEFYNNHKTIRFTTPEEDAEYEILSIFNSRVYYKSETNVFRYYFFVDATIRKEYDEFVENAKKVSIYDTGVDAKYGDQLLTLSTCDYSQEDGRFVVIAKKVNK